MIIYKTTIVIIVLFFGLNCYSQAPGYMGHRFSIEGDVNILPSFVNEARGYNDDYYRDNGYYNDNFLFPLSKTGASQYRPISLNLNSSLSLNFSLKKQVDLSLRLNYVRGKYGLKTVSFYSRIRDVSNLKIRSNNLLTPYNMLEYNVNFKFYSGDYIAPVGNYVLLGFGVVNVSSVLEVNYHYMSSAYSNYNDSSIVGSKKIRLSENFMKINLGFFRKKFINKKLYINYGVEFNVYFLKNDDPKIKFITEDLFEVDDLFNLKTTPEIKSIDELIEASYRRNVGRHIAIENRYNLKIGLGIIL